MKKINPNNIQASVEGSPLSTHICIGDIHLGPTPTVDDIHYIRGLEIQTFIDFGPLGKTEEEEIEKDGGRYFHCPIEDVSKIDHMFLQGVDQLLNSEIGPVYLYSENLGHLIAWLVFHLSLIQKIEFDNALEVVEKLNLLSDEDKVAIESVIKKEQQGATICL